jgi:hypothetical protein
MFTKTSFSKRFTSGISRFWLLLFQSARVQLCTAHTWAIRLIWPSAFLFTFFVQEYRQSSHTTDGKTITSIISSNQNYRKQWNSPNSLFGNSLLLAAKKTTVLSNVLPWRRRKEEEARGTSVRCSLPPSTPKETGTRSTFKRPFEYSRSNVRDGLIVRSKIFKLLAPCNLQAKEPESWNSFDV